MALLSVIRRWHFREHLSIRAIARRTGLSRNTIRKYLRSEAVEPVFRTPDRPSKLDPFAERLPAAETICIDLEAGLKSVQDWRGDSIPIRRFDDAIAIACLIGGVNPAADPNGFFSEAHYQHLATAHPDLVRLIAGKSIVFLDSITDLTRQAIAWAKTRPEAFSEKTGKPDTRGAYICMSSSEWPTLHRAWQEAGGKWSSTIIWAKNTFALGRADYHQQFEAMLYGWKAGAQHYWCGSRDQGNVWHFDKPARNDLHPTMKPVALVERAIRNSSKPRDTVLDCFGGSGTTMIAAERTGRRAVLLEIDPAYCDVIVQRWQEETGQAAVLDGEDRTFADVSALRQAA